MKRKSWNKAGLPSVWIKRIQANAWGIASSIFGLIGLYILATIFAPLALVLGAIAVVKKQYASAVLGLVCGGIGFVYIWGWLMS